MPRKLKTRRRSGIKKSKSRSVKRSVSRRAGRRAGRRASRKKSMCGGEAVATTVKSDIDELAHRVVSLQWHLHTTMKKADAKRMSDHLQAAVTIVLAAAKVAAEHLTDAVASVEEEAHRVMDEAGVVDQNASMAAKVLRVVGQLKMEVASVVDELNRTADTIGQISINTLGQKVASVVDELNARKQKTNSLLDILYGVDTVRSKFLHEREIMPPSTSQHIEQNDKHVKVSHNARNKVSISELSKSKLSELSKLSKLLPYHK